MIVIKKISGTSNGREFVQPERELTERERSRVVAVWGDANSYWYFEEGDKATQQWADYQSHLNQKGDTRTEIDNILDGLTNDQLRRIKQRMASL